MKLLLLAVVLLCRLPKAAAAAAPKVTLTKWLYEIENGIGSGSVWMTLGGNATAHRDAVHRGLESAALAAQAPPFDLSAYLEVDDPERFVDELPRFLVEHSGRYGVVVVADAENFPVWILKMVATSFWGKTRCASANPPFVFEQVDCSRIAWFLSTSFGSDALYSGISSQSSDSAVASDARRRWPSREAGSLSVKATRIDRCVFVQGEAPASLMAAVAASQLESKARTSEAAAESLEEWLSQRFVGQIGAVSAVASRLRGLEFSTTKAPKAFYFYGVAGSGKTRLAQLIAEALGRPKIQLEMESYSAAEDANRLFGSPPGYGQGYGLVDEMIKQPGAVVVLDEIEKAHPTIFREKLHSVLSEGVIRDKRNRSRVADVSDAIFVFTTNCFEDFVGGLDESEPYESKRDKAAVAINEHPRIPCSSSRPMNPFDDGSLRSRLPPSKQFPFFPLTQSERTRVVSVELDRLSAHFSFNLSWFPDIPSRYASIQGDARTAIDALHLDIERALAATPPSSTRGVLRFSQQPSFLNDKEGNSRSPLSIAWIQESDLPPPLAYTHVSPPMPSPKERGKNRAEAPIAADAGPSPPTPPPNDKVAQTPVYVIEHGHLSEKTAVDHAATEVQEDAPSSSVSFSEAQAECDAPLEHEEETLPEARVSLLEDACAYALVLIAVFFAFRAYSRVSNKLNTFRAGFAVLAFSTATPVVAAAIGCAALAYVPSLQYSIRLSLLRRLIAMLGPRRALKVVLETAVQGVAAMAKHLSPSAVTTGIVFALLYHNPNLLLLRWLPFLTKKKSQVDVGTMTDDWREYSTHRPQRFSVSATEASSMRSSSF